MVRRFSPSGGTGGLTAGAESASSSGAGWSVDLGRREALVETGEVRRLGSSNQLEILYALDISFAGFFDKRWLVSRKRTTNLADLVNAWKKVVLDREREGDDPYQSPDGWD